MTDLQPPAGLRLTPLDPATATDAVLQEWREVHNAIIPADPLSLADVRERVGRHRLELAHLGPTLVGCSTVRPPQPDGRTATVIARVLPAHRGQGIGTALYTAGLARARALGAEAIETVVLESNTDGLRFAAARGFTELERYLLPGDTIRYVDLRLAD
ncbi:N-acetyltransferase family protein [Kitasatospora sp. LaBMicrA B282]|uniref:GNAT family N-acetyltransferase n=1 Tax=Kitasatospora sp. LaBMicrA B282 TaxID=3420949 RepID=UPI003D0FC998